MASGDEHRDAQVVGGSSDELQPADPYDLTGRTLSHYRLGRRIGTGGMGVVYTAEDLRLLRSVALKVLPPWSEFDPNARSRFIREARAASVINHANVCTIYEYEEVEGRAFIAMELVDGPTVQRLLIDGPVEREKALRIAAGVAAGLDHAHARKIVHRDVKPANIILTGEGEPKITDFGIAKIAESTTITRTGWTLGTTAYMSPEQAMGEDVGAPSDVWSLGVVLYEMLMGKRPFPGDHPSAVLYSVVNLDPEGLDQIQERYGSECREIISACLSKDPAVRPTAGELSRKLATLNPPRPHLEKKRETRRVAWGAAAVLSLVAVVVATMIGLFGYDSDRPSLNTASIALIPPALVDSSLKVTVDGFLSSLTGAVDEIAQRENLVADLVFFQPNAADERSAMEQAKGSLGVDYVIRTELQTDNPDPTIRFVLTSSRDGSVVDAGESRILNRDWKSSYQASLSALVSMLGLPQGRAVPLPAIYEPTRPDALQYYTTAMGLVQQGTIAGIDAGIELLRRVLRESPDYAGAYAGLCRAYVRKSDLLNDLDYLDEAELLCDRSIELDGSMSDAYLVLGKIHVKTGRFGQATSFFETVLERDSTNAEALIGLARVSEEAGDVGLAESLYRKAIAFRPNWDSYRQLGIFLYFQSRYEEALEQLNYSLELAPLNPWTYANLGAVHWRLEDLDHAEEYWLSAIDLEPDYKIYNNLGALYFFKQDYEKAARMYERALSISEGDFLVWGNLGTAYRWSGQSEDAYRAAKERALEMAEHALEINPRDKSIVAKLAGYHAELGDTLEAEQYLQKIGENPDLALTGETIFEAGAAMEAIGKRSLAIGWIEAALQRGYSTSELMRYPGLDSLRNDPAFRSILRQHGVLKAGEG